MAPCFKEDFCAILAPIPLWYTAYHCILCLYYSQISCNPFFHGYLGNQNAIRVEKGKENRLDLLMLAFVL